MPCGPGWAAESSFATTIQPGVPLRRLIPWVRGTGPGPIEVFGIEPPIWATAVQGEALSEALVQAEGSWTTRPYDHAAWFFGAGGALPRWAGYSMGFELVGRYLEADPARAPSRLYDEPADRFRPQPGAAVLTRAETPPPAPAR